MIVRTGVYTEFIKYAAERSKTTELVNVFYDLVTDLYEWGWGQVSFCLRRSQLLTDHDRSRHTIKQSLEAAVEGFPTLPCTACSL